MLATVIRYFYPDLPKDEIKKFGLLSFAFFFLIGTYWIIRLFKKAVFFKIAFPESLGWAAKQGGLFEPLAKTLSVVVVIIAVLIYSKLVDWFEKHKLFYIICSFYTLIFAGITAVLFVQETYGNEYVGRTLLAALGWGSYFAIETFGSVVVALFWSFVASITDTESAKRGFALIIVGGQLGAIGGASLNIFVPRLGSIWRLPLIATFFIMAIMAVIYLFTHHIPASKLIGNRKAAATEKIKEGFVEGFVSGIRLLFTRSYLFGILIISTFYEVVNTITEYQMNRQADIVYTTTASFSQFQGMYGVCVNTLSLLLALLGTTYLMKRFGLTFCLLAFPIALGGAVSALLAFFKFGAPSPAALLYATAGVMILAKGLSYALNNPAKEMMYIPTSRDAKFKTKGWVDMFGGRTAKMSGAQISDLFKANLGELMFFGTILSLGLIWVWIVFALFVGRKNYALTQSGTIVE